jgi:hypothetical protein
MVSLAPSIWFPVVTLVIGIVLTAVLQVFADARRDRRDRARERDTFRRERSLEFLEAMETRGEVQTQARTARLTGQDMRPVQDRAHAIHLRCFTLAAQVDNDSNDLVKAVVMLGAREDVLMMGTDPATIDQDFAAIGKEMGNVLVWAVEIQRTL